MCLNVISQVRLTLSLLPLLNPEATDTRTDRIHIFNFLARFSRIFGQI
jgi:hypothetical protein